MLKNIIIKNLQLKKVLLLFILANLVYLFMLFVTIPKVMSFTNGMKILDMMPTGYNYDYMIKLFNALNESGRNVYLYNQIPVDMIYPFLFGISNCLLLAYFFNKLKMLNGNLIYLCLLPLFAGLFDYLENFGIIIMLNNFPNISQFSVSITNIFSIIKSFSTAIYFILLILTAAAFGIKSIRQKVTQ